MLPRAVPLALCLALAPFWSPAAPAGIRQFYGPPDFTGTQIFQPQAYRPQPERPSAEVDIISGADPHVHGRLYLYQRGPGVYIAGYIKGLAPGLHGFHVHQVAALGNQCKDAGPHFNPFMKNHGSRQSIERHVGDLGNIQANPYGDAYINLYDDVISLDPASEAYIGDRSFVVHEKEDDLGLGGDEGSLSTGNAGARLGCGLVRITPPWYAEPTYSHTHAQSAIVFG